MVEVNSSVRAARIHVETSERTLKDAERAATEAKKRAQQAKLALKKAKKAAKKAGKSARKARKALAKAMKHGKTDEPARPSNAREVVKGAAKKKSARKSVAQLKQKAVVPKRAPSRTRPAKNITPAEPDTFTMGATDLG